MAFYLIPKTKDVKVCKPLLDSEGREMLDSFNKLLTTTVFEVRIFWLWFKFKPFW